MIHDEICTYEVCKLAKEKGFNEECRDFYCDDKLQKRITRTSCNRQVTSFDYCSNSMLEDYDSPKEYYNIAAPTQSLLQRWLREEKKISVEVSWFEVGKKYFWVAKDMNNHDVFKPKTTKCMTFYDTWEQALEHGLKYALKELK